MRVLLTCRLTALAAGLTEVPPVSWSGGADVRGLEWHTFDRERSIVLPGRSVNAGNIR